MRSMLVVSVVILSIFVSGDSYLGTGASPVPPVGVKFCMMVHMCPGCVFTLLGMVPPEDPPNLFI